MPTGFGTAPGYYRWLHSIVDDRGAGALSTLAEFVADNDTTEVVGPAIAVMVLWGDTGLRQIANLGADVSVKDCSEALIVLSTVASGQAMTQATGWIIDATLLAEVNSFLAANDLRDFARRSLHDLLSAKAEDDLLIPLGLAFMQMGMDNEAIASELVAAVSARWLRFGRRDLDQFEALLNSHPEDEPSLHSFLEKYPQMLDPMARQVWSKPDFHGFREPDFLIRRSDDTYLVVEIENAAKPLMTQAEQPSSAVTQAVQQVNDYRSFIEDRVQEARLHFPNIHSSIDAMAVIGMEARLTPGQARALIRENLSRSRTRVVGFDWLLARGRSVLTNVTDPRVDVVIHHRVI